MISTQEWQRRSEESLQKAQIKREEPRPREWVYAGIFGILGALFFLIAINWPSLLGL